MGKNKSVILKVAGCAVFVFAIGIVVGCGIGNESVKSLQGYLLDRITRASSSNSSNSNAQIYMNASSSNASSANVVIPDNFLMISSFSINGSTVKQGDRVDINIDTVGAPVVSASLLFKTVDGSDLFSTTVRNFSTDQYIVIPNNVLTGEYVVNSVFINARNSDGTVFGQNFSVDNGSGSINYFNFNSKLTIIPKDNKKEIKLEGVSLSTDKTMVGDKVFFDVKTNVLITDLQMTFSDGKNTFVAYGRDLEFAKPYIEIPSNVKEGTYNLIKLKITSSDESVVYTKDGKNGTNRYFLNSTLKIEANPNASYVYNNEDLDSELLSQIYSAPNGSSITINVDSNSIVSDKLFTAIKGSDKKLVINSGDHQLIFNGKDIKNAKSIDVVISIEDLAYHEDINQFTDEGIVVNFPDNGNLPGKALVRIKATEDIEDILEDKVYVYMYSVSDNKFYEIATDVRKTDDGYYEFNITHNSDFLIMNKVLDKKYVLENSPDGNKIVMFQKGNKIHLLLIGLGSLLVICACVVVLVLKNRKTTKKKKDKKDSKDNKETKEEKDDKKE